MFACDHFIFTNFLPFQVIEEITSAEHQQVIFTSATTVRQAEELLQDTSNEILNPV